MASVLVTGGGGFIGLHLTKSLIGKHRVTVLDNGSLRPEAVETFDRLGVDIVRESVTEQSLPIELFDESDVVVHAAAVAGVEKVMENPFLTIETNLVGSLNVMNKARLASSRPRVVLFSTSEVYGKVAYRSSELDPTIVPPPTDGRWHYAASKLMMEHAAFAMQREFGLDFVILRPFNVFGPGQLSGGAVREFVHRVKSGEHIEIHGDGSQLRSWCFVDDFVEAVELAMFSSTAAGQIFNIGNPVNTITVLDLARRIQSISGNKTGVKHIPELAASVDLRIPDTSKAKELLGWTAATDLESGLQQTIFSS